VEVVVVARSTECLTTCSTRGSILIFIVFLMNELPRNLRPESETIIVMFLFQRNDSLKSVWATEGGIHNASSRMQERQWGNWSFGSHSFTEAESNKTSEQSGPLRLENSECPQFDGVGTRATPQHNWLLIIADALVK
jgi:hypothetical protein